MQHHLSRFNRPSNVAPNIQTTGGFFHKKRLFLLLGKIIVIFRELKLLKKVSMSASLIPKAENLLRDRDLKGLLHRINIAQHFNTDCLHPGNLT